jgi:hypothetical protein
MGKCKRNGWVLTLHRTSIPALLYFVLSRLMHVYYGSNAVKAPDVFLLSNFDREDGADLCMV